MPAVRHRAWQPPKAMERGTEKLTLSAARTMPRWGFRTSPANATMPMPSIEAGVPFGFRLVAPL